MSDRNDASPRSEPPETGPGGEPVTQSVVVARTASSITAYTAAGPTDLLSVYGLLMQAAVYVQGQLLQASVRPSLIERAAFPPPVDTRRWPRP